MRSCTYAEKIGKYSAQSKSWGDLQTESILKAIFTGQFSRMEVLLAQGVYAKYVNNHWLTTIFNNPFTALGNHK